MLRVVLGLAACTSAVIGCTEFSPSAGGDGGLGSNTNWFRACDADAECGEDLGCICGTCTKACAHDSDCGDEGDGICPIDKGAYAASCGPQAALDSQRSMCFQKCEESSDCPGSRVCIAGACAEVEPDPCSEADSIEFESSSPELRARVGALFGDQFYEPQWYASYPETWEEPVEPSVLTARVLDADGSPVEGCRVDFFSEETSGFAYAQNPFSDESGEVTALWVAGTAAEQTLRAAVHGAGDWLFAELSGEARRHDEPPQVMGPQGANYTAPSALVVAPEQSEPATQLRATFTPLTFPSRVSYAILETDRISIQYTNDGSSDPAETDVPPGERLLELAIFDQSGESGSVVAILQDAYCVFDYSGDGFVCQFSDAWEPGESLTVRVETREVALGEAPGDYDPFTHSSEPCRSSSGCTDYSVFVTRAGEEESRVAVLRAPGLEDFSDRTLYVTGLYTPSYGIASSCLGTERAAMIASHELRIGGQWEWSNAGSSWASYETWQNETCANYAAYAISDGFYLSTGGPSPISTPGLPGVAREL